MHRQTDLLDVWKRRWAIHLGAAVALTAARLWLADGAPNPLAVAPSIKAVYATSYALAIWLDLRPGGRGPAILCSRECRRLPSIVAVAVAILLVSYHCLVRFSWIGRVLNGRA